MFENKGDGPSDGRTDGWTDGRTDGRTDTTSYRDAKSHLKTQTIGKLVNGRRNRRILEMFEKQEEEKKRKNS